MKLYFKRNISVIPNLFCSYLRTFLVLYILRCTSILLITINYKHHNAHRKVTINVSLKTKAPCNLFLCVFVSKC